MASLRFAALAALLGVGASPPDPVPPPVTLTLGQTPGSLTVTNTSDTNQWLDRGMQVQTLRDGRWTPVDTTFDLIAQCDARFPRRMQPVRLPPRQTVAVVPWTGTGCSSQCSHTCRLNRYYGGGPFRFVARRYPSGEDFVSPVFRMPDQRQDPKGLPITLDQILEAARRPRAGPNDP